MADKESGINIPVYASVDEGSVKQAVSKIDSDVQKATKNSHIEVPVDITVPISKTKTDLTKAQSDVAQLLSKMSKRGFSAYAKD